MEPTLPWLDDFKRAIALPDDEIDLARAALLLTRLEELDFDPEPVVRKLDAMAGQVVERCGGEAGQLVRLQALMEVVLREPGLTGARDDYYNPSNSFLGHVLERRVGLPIALGVLLIGVGARAGVALGGTSMPMHFLVRILGIRPPLFIDSYGGGQLMTQEAAAQLVGLMCEGRLSFRPEMLELVSNEAILMRMLLNLRMAYQQLDRPDRLLDVAEMMVALAPGDASLVRERGLAQFRLGRIAAARVDLERYLELAENPADADQIRALLKTLG